MAWKGDGYRHALAAKGITTKRSETKLTYSHSHQYARIWIDGKMVYHHRYIMEKHLGRKLKKCELVHHINGDVHDNRIKNLEVVDLAKHNSEHKPKDAKVKKAKRVKRE